MRGINFVPNSFIKTSALSINNLYPRVKCSWYLLFNSQLGQRSLNQQVSRIIKQDTPLRSVMLPTSTTVHRERNTKQTKKRQRSHYMALLGIILVKTFSLFFLPPSLSSVFLLDWGFLKVFYILETEAAYSEFL